MEDKLNIEFNDKDLLKEALTHPSFSRDGVDYERLEFLGDSILGLSVSEELFRRYPDENEGQLTKRLSGLICGSTLVKVARKLDLGEDIKMSKSEKNAGGHDNKTNLENVMEALIGAIYLDQGFEVTKKFVLEQWEEYIAEMIEPPKDAKSALQEWAQGRGLELPQYTVTKQEGPSHAPEFEIEVFVEGQEKKVGAGNSKRIAEQAAATKLLKVLEGSL